MHTIVARSLALSVLCGLWWLPLEPPPAEPYLCVRDIVAGFALLCLADIATSLASNKGCKQWLVTTFSPNDQSPHVPAEGHGVFPGRRKS